MSILSNLKSITTQLTLLFIATGVLILFVFKLTSTLSLNNQIETNIRPNFIHYAHYIIEEIGAPPSLELAQKVSSRLGIDIAINGGNIRWYSTEKPIDLSRVQFLQPQINHENINMHSAIYNNNFAVWVRTGDYDIVLVMNSSIKSKYDWGAIIGISIIMALLTLLFLFMFWLFKALQELQKDVLRIGSGDLKHRINIKRSDDLGDLAAAFNGMADDIQNMLEAKRQMLLAISHELRSPLTRSKLALAVMKHSPQKDSILLDIDEMEAMINELLEAERLNAKHKALNLESHDINTIISDVITEYFPEDNIALQLDYNLPKQQLDSVRIRFIIKNILENALKYQDNQNKAILIETRQDEQATELRVTDQGTGIAPEHIPRLTEPFYRADPSRQRKTGGFGLGLYLCKLIAEAHKGYLIITSELGQGSCITVMLPQQQ